VVEHLGVVTLRNAQPPSGTLQKVKGALGTGPVKDLETFATRFVAAMSAHRHWGRTLKGGVPA
jgi:hypothetical protein